MTYSGKLNTFYLLYVLCSGAKDAIDMPPLSPIQLICGDLHRPNNQYMKSRDEQLKKIIEWATSNNDIRVLLLTSSLTNPNAPSDIFSDLDIELITTNLPLMLASDAWLEQFGPVMVKIVENEEAFDGLHAMRMVLYDDYSKIDFKLWSVDKFKEEVNNPELYEDWDIGHKVLLDKDGLTAGLNAPTYQSVVISQPTEQEFQRILNDYWWDTHYVAKCLWRDNIFYAKFMLEHEIRANYLQKIIEWYIASEHNWQVTTNKFGRLFKQFLSPAIWEQVEQTFAGAGIEDNWRSLFAANDLVRKMGLHLANRLNYTYPTALDEKMTRYLQLVKNLDKDATEIA
jgi:aminoglycoside 6-adenylyltransferase